MLEIFHNKNVLKSCPSPGPSPVSGGEPGRAFGRAAAVLLRLFEAASSSPDSAAILPCPRGCRLPVEKYHSLNICSALSLNPLQPRALPGHSPNSKRPPLPKTPSPGSSIFGGFSSLPTLPSQFHFHRVCSRKTPPRMSLNDPGAPSRSARHGGGIGTCQLHWIKWK